MADWWPAPEGVRVSPDGSWSVGEFRIVHLPSLRFLKERLVFEDEGAFLVEGERRLLRQGDRHRLARRVPQVLDDDALRGRGDARALDGHDVHLVRVEHEQRARGDLAVLQQQVAGEVDAVLRPYGGLGAIPRRLQISALMALEKLGPKARPALDDVDKLAKVGGPRAKSTAMRVAKKIREGGSGVWGPVPMPPNPAVSDADMKTMIAYILALK